MNLRVKYFLFNLTWFSILSLLLILFLTVFLEASVNWLFVKIEILFLIISSLLTQVSVSEKEESDFKNGIYEVLTFFITLFSLLICAFIVVVLIHMFLDINSLSIKKYLFGFLVGTIFLIFMSRFFLSN